MIGAFGSTQESGKPRGSDIVQGKWTYVVQQALQHGSAAQRRAINAAFGKQRVSSAVLEAAIEALSDSGARSASERRIEQLLIQSRRSLKKMRLTTRGRELLTGAVSALSDRRS